MRSHRRFRPSVEFMCVRIAPSAVGSDVTNPLADGTTIPTGPVIDINDLSTAPNVDDANLLIIAPMSPTTNPTSSLC